MTTDQAGINDDTGAIQLPDMNDDNPPSVIMTAPTSSTSDFPFTPSDVAWWIVKRSDGIVAKYVMVNKKDGTTSPSTSLVHTSLNTPHRAGSLSRWCNHTPKGESILSENGIKLWVADAPGLRMVRNKFDFILDNGQVLKLADIARTLEGDEDLIYHLNQFSLYTEPRLLKLDWEDRAAPPVEMGFFPEYLKHAQGNVVTACQGGHGRSGTSAVAFMMCLIPTYTPYAAICHLRALHCPRAIESKEQHEWIGKFGEYLKRENDVARISEVTSFRKAFLELDVKGAEKYQEQCEKMEEGKNE